MNALLALVRVQLRLYLSNRRALAINLLMPILIAAFFGSLFGGNESPAHIKVGLVDEDRSELSQAIAAAMAQDAALDLQTLDRASATTLVRGGKLPAALVLPAGFGEAASRAMVGGAKAEAAIFYDPSDRISLNLLRGLFAQHAMQQTMSHAFSGAAGQARLDSTLKALQDNAALDGKTRNSLQQLFTSLGALQQRDASAASAPGAASAASAPPAAAAATGMTLPYTLREEGLSAGGQRGYNGYAHSFAGMGVQFVLMLGVDLAVGILLARRAGLWLRLRSAPLSRGVLLASHFCSTALIASAILGLVLLVGMVVFGFGVSGSWLGLALLVVSYGLFTAGFGLFLAALGGSPEATRGLAILATLLMVMLGGAWVPSFVFPAWLQDLTLLVPVRWAVDGFDAMTWRGLGLASALPAVGILLGSALLLALLAVWRFDWRE
ncbi:ABC transporter permease [Paucibacter sp. APW11]|uniref:ABC transporter permease n=1 Tax=Roseateles aquae TaxID=3077235 RepID=A0ABU3PAS7_9BURK|nr:ABC transporter permease [Paucibacter sp. APW11]MDT8998846.1 ABC transporter permease [Paucibacter sp. APW11]